MTTNKFDFIGDIHGHVDALEKLLKKLGYSQVDGTYKHPSRQAFFVGDFIDRGPQVLKTLEIVKRMVDAGSALAVMGNHEFNFIQLFTKSAENPDEWARPHEKMHQAQTTLDDFEGKEDLLHEYIAWFKTLPVYFETDQFRVVHAQWDDRSIEKVKKLCYSDDGSERHGILNEKYFSHTQGEAHDAIEMLLSGFEMELPNGITFNDTYNKPRNEMRIMWWERGEALSLQDVADYKVKLDDAASNIPYSHDAYKQYGPKDVPIFFGHYCLQRAIDLRQNNICCLDFCVGKGGELVGYSFNGEEVLDEGNLIY